ncbi:ubiquitin-like protein 7 isoform X1 [Schistocerca gregaria]|uniref:ubiquitin-like protein 7 isoform X1 n=1 Tax=Schistocerca gregaria TaxID=7010 RepID=UPI00211E013D|nr:ubiquitin-like protein 7 isoform X1 [Schistocerca gregaria]
MSRIVFGIRLSPNTYQRVKIEGIDLECTVDHLKQEASRVTNLPKSFLELVYCGNILEDEATLRASGLKSDSTVHVLKKREKEAPVPSRPLSEMDIQELVMAFKTFLKHPSYRSALHRLNRAEVVENIIQATPGLLDDPIAISILQEPELLVHLENADTVRRIAEAHPALAEAAGHIAAAVQEEAATSSHPTDLPGSSSGYSYSLDGLSDDDEMDSSQVLSTSEYSYYSLDELSEDEDVDSSHLLNSSDYYYWLQHGSSDSEDGDDVGQELGASQVQGTNTRHFSDSGVTPDSSVPSSGSSESLHRVSDGCDTHGTHDSQSSDSQPRGSDLSRQQSYSAITSAQLAAALASATGFMSSSPQPSGSGSTSGLITPELFNQAMQQAIASAGGGEDQSSDTEGQSSPSRRRLSRQLQQMQEMGLSDEALNRQALVATGGDVQAAINLVFSWGLSSSPP